MSRGRFPFFYFSAKVAVMLVLIFSPLVIRAALANPISGQDVNGHPVALNGTGRCTVVMYTNPDLEDTSRKVTVALDSYRTRPDFKLVRVVDFRGGVPPAMRSIVRVQIRNELDKESLRLKKAGVTLSPQEAAPIIPDFSGSTLNALGWNDIYDDVHLVIYDRKGNEVKRLEKVSDPKQVTKAVDAIL